MMGKNPERFWGYSFIQQFFEKKIYIFFVFLFIALSFNIDKIILGEFSFVRIHDTFDSEFSKYFPYGTYLLKNGIFNWYPNFCGGIPSFASQFPPYYILAAIVPFFSSWLVYAAVVILLMAFAGFGMYRLMEEFFGIRRSAAFFGGLFFSFVSQIQPNSIIHTIFNYLLPIFIVLFIDLLNNEISLLRRIGCGLGIVFIFLLSYPAITLPIYAAIHLYIIIFFSRSEFSTRAIFFTFTVWIAYVLLLSPVIYDLFQYIPYAQRKYGIIESSVFTIENVIIFFKDINTQFFHILTMTLLIIPTVASIMFLLSSRAVRLLWILLVVLLFVSSFFHSPFSAIFSHTFIAKMDLGHFSWTIPFVTMLLSFSGLNELLSNHGRKKTYLLLSVAAMAYLAIMLFFYNQTYVTLYKYFFVNLFILIVILIVYFFHESISKNFLKSFGKSSFRSVAVLLSIFFICSAFLIQIKYLRFAGEEPENVPYRKIFENHSLLKEIRNSNVTPFRIGSLDNIPHMFGLYGIEAIDGRGPLFNKYYKDFFKLIIRNQLRSKDSENFFDNYWYQLYLKNSTGNFDFNFGLLCLLNTKYLTSFYYYNEMKHHTKNIYYTKSDAENYNGFFLKYVKKNITLPLYVYELKDSFERAFFIPQGKILGSDMEVLDALSQQSADLLKRTVFYSEQDSIDIDRHLKALPQQSIAANSLNLVEYSPDRIVYLVRIKNPCILFISNNFHFNWKATVNGKNKKIYRTNHSFQSVVLDQTGEYDVVFEYKDRMLSKIHWLMILGFVIIFLPLFFFRIKKSSQIL